MPKIVKAKLPDEPMRNRLRDLDAAGEYIGVSRRSVERLIEIGKLPVIKLPLAVRNKTLAAHGPNRRVLIDTRDLDKLIEESRETRR